ncbi:hypothetical protein GCM10009069_08740 [Algimonas arctica]|uniref:Uncharacterized protein n=1 Tax=Algimonas arctica TaxID=1479486 RepID=A0A8J3CN60_9PROT|nr:hypothetical protein GCM10009069_08740 [Algimonas arctica]
MRDLLRNNDDTIRNPHIETNAIGVKKYVVFGANVFAMVSKMTILEILSVKLTNLLYLPLYKITIDLQCVVLAEQMESVKTGKTVYDRIDICRTPRPLLSKP